tara:strand:- start:1 stop:225 length:225 start_codon:yes stop_codon:yes gene_type:complete
LKDKQKEINGIIDLAKRELHDLISPLNALDYYIDNIRVGNEDDKDFEEKYLKTQECLESLYSRINHLNELFKNI